MTREMEISRKSRLETVEEVDLEPLRRARRMEACALYWIPVYMEPLGEPEQHWLMTFFDALHNVLTEVHFLQQESFLQMKTVAPLGKPKELLHKHQTNLMPISGLGLRPGAKLPPVPTEEDLQPIMEGKKKFVFNDYVGDYSLWLLARDERWKRNLFLGYGGYTMLYLPPDPKTEAPPLPDYPGMRSMPLFTQYDVEGLWKMAHLLGGEFGSKSKAVFGKNFRDDPSYDGTAFIIPLMNSKDYFQAGTDEVQEWFSVFDVLIQESVEDRGILLASKMDLDKELSEILRNMREKRIDHPFLPWRRDEQNV